jgi:NAD-dependent dihydropyrimidine dehydrogenase PreA subunit
MNLIRIDQIACTGCTACVESCPTDVIRMNSSHKAEAVYAEDCQVCFLCEFDCPVDAIRVFPRGVPAQAAMKGGRGNDLARA